MISQRSIKSLVKATGVGVHSGQRVDLTLRPAAADTGIVFRRVDLPQIVDIPVSSTAVTDTRMATTISSPGHSDARVQTIEHLLSACSGLGIDNLYVDINAEEVPILDGSASSFVFLLQSAGVMMQSVPKRFVRVLKEIEVQIGEGDQLKWAKLSPFEGFKLSFQIEFGHPAVDATGQLVEFDMAIGNYARDVARARTFGFTRDVENLRAKGLGMGGGLDNAIVMDDYKVLNSGGLRYDDEFVKHKILDAMGDLYCLGKPLIGSYSAYRSGHALNNLLLRRLLSQPDAYEVVSFVDESKAPTGFSRLIPAW